VSILHHVSVTSASLIDELFKKAVANSKDFVIHLLINYRANPNRRLTNLNKQTRPIILARRADISESFALTRDVLFNRIKQ
jgi:hypothetical protein